MPGSQPVSPSPDPPSFPNPFIQFQGEQHPDRHRGLLKWPGHPVYKLPVRGELSTEYIHPAELSKRLCIVTEQYADLFDLTDAKDQEYYEWVLRRIRAGWFVLDRLETRWTDDAAKIRIYLEWTQRYTESTKSKDGRNAGSTNGPITFS